MTGSSSLVRLLPYLPGPVQAGLIAPDSLADVLEHPDGGLHVPLEVFRAARRTLPATATSALAARCTTQEVLALLVDDKRVSVTEALTTNPHLPAASARTLLDRLLRPSAGPTPARWEQITRLVDRLVSIEGAGALTEQLDRLVAHRDTHHPLPSDIIPTLFAHLDDHAMSDLITDPRVHRVCGQGPLRLLATLTGHPEGGEGRRRRDSPPAGRPPLTPQLALTAALAELADGRVPAHHELPYASRSVSRAVRQLAAAIAATAATADLTPETQAHLVNILSALDQQQAGRLLTLIGDRPARVEDRLYSTLTDPVHALGAALRYCAEADRTFPVPAALADTIATLRKPTGVKTLLELAPYAGAFRLCDDAAGRLRTADSSAGADLLTILDQLSAAPHQQLTDRIDDRLTSRILLSEEYTTVDSIGRVCSALIRRRAAGDTVRAGQLAVELYRSTATDAGFSTTVWRRRSLRTVHHLLADGDLTIAGLACIDGGVETIGQLATSDTLPGSEHRSRYTTRDHGSRERRSGARSITGRLAELPAPVRVELLAVALTAASRGEDTLLGHLRPWHRQDTIVVDAALQAGVTRELLTGALPLATTARQRALLVQRCSSAAGQRDRRDQRDQIEGIVRATDQVLLEGRTPDWLDAIAHHLPTTTIRSAVRSSPAAVLAAVLGELVGDDVELWRTVLVLLERWEGTLVELVETARAL
jgi:hypothetical protein